MAIDPLYRLDHARIRSAFSFLMYRNRLQRNRLYNKSAQHPSAIQPGDQRIVSDV
jgi:hypothetical protein